MPSDSLGYDPRPGERNWRGTPIPPVADPLPATGKLPEIAERMWWNGPAWTILRNSGEFLRHAIDHATEKDLAYLWETIAVERWRKALLEATPGTMSRSRYRLWCLWLDIDDIVPAADWRDDGHLNDYTPELSREQAYELHARHAARQRRTIAGPAKPAATDASASAQG